MLKNCIQLLQGEILNYTVENMPCNKELYLYSTIRNLQTGG